MNIYSIYKVTNKINNKIYIGFDSQWPKRMISHFYKFRSNKAKHSALHLAIKKYGWDNFKWEVIYQSKEKDHTLKEMEPLFIKEFQSFKNGYNLTEGGEGTFGKKQSEKNKSLQSQTISERNKKSKWYNDGKNNKFCSFHPGNEWTLGRINQRPTTKGCKWYNNGHTQVLTKNPPKDWKQGMLPKK